MSTPRSTRERIAALLAAKKDNEFTEDLIDLFNRVIPVEKGIHESRKSGTDRIDDADIFLGEFNLVMNKYGLSEFAGDMNGVKLFLEHLASLGVPEGLMLGGRPVNRGSLAEQLGARGPRTVPVTDTAGKVQAMFMDIEAGSYYPDDEAFRNLQRHLVDSGALVAIGLTGNAGPDDMRAQTEGNNSGEKAVRKRDEVKADTVSGGFWQRFWGSGNRHSVDAGTDNSKLNSREGSENSGADEPGHIKHKTQPLRTGSNADSRLLKPRFPEITVILNGKPSDSHQQLSALLNTHLGSHAVPIVEFNALMRESVNRSVRPTPSTVKVCITRFEDRVDHSGAATKEPYATTVSVSHNNRRTIYAVPEQLNSLQAERQKLLDMARDHIESYRADYPGKTRITVSQKDASGGGFMLMLAEYNDSLQADKKFTIAFKPPLDEIKAQYQPLMNLSSPHR